MPMKTCLIVDDSRFIRKVASQILEELKFHIVEAEDGEQALTACIRQFPDVILLDANMPKLNGYEFLNSLRHLPGGDRPKVLFFTSENKIENTIRAAFAGADEYLMKPFDTEMVASKFKELGLI